MKISFLSLFLLLSLSLCVASCSSSDEGEPLAIKLSVPTADEEWITTDLLDFEFEILEGNGGYTATVSENDGDPSAIVTINGNVVTVALLTHEHLGARVTITDRRNQSAEVFVSSTHESLQSITGYTLQMDAETSSEMPIDFGAGAPYTLEKKRGSAAEATVEGSTITANALRLGETLYKVKDKRGTVTSFRVSTPLQFVMDQETKSLEYTTIHDAAAHIALDWGTEWKIIHSENTVAESVNVGELINAKGKYLLSIYTTPKGSVGGTDIVKARNAEGDTITIKITVE